MNPKLRAAGVGGVALIGILSSLAVGHDADAAVSYRVKSSTASIANIYAYSGTYCNGSSTLLHPGDSASSKKSFYSVTDGHYTYSSGGTYYMAPKTCYNAYGNVTINND